MNQKGILYQQIRPGQWHAVTIDRILAEGRTRMQKYRILELNGFGKCMELNDCIQSTEFDESYYHESLLFPAITQHGNIQRVLCFGGANGGVLNRLLHVPTITEVCQIDIDPEVYNLSKHYLPHMHPQSELPFHFELQFCDNPFDWAMDNQKRYEGHFDLIIADLPDATADSYVPTLFTEQFYGAVKSMLSETGLFATQAGQVNPVEMQFHTRTITTLEQTFKNVAGYSAFIPSYGTPWGFALASEDIKVGKIAPGILEKNFRIVAGEHLQYYDLETHQHLFSKPRPNRWDQYSSEVAAISKDNLALVDISGKVQVKG